MNARPYQIEARQCVIADLQERRSTLVVMATGLGKGYVFSSLADDCMSGQWLNGNVLILANRSVLIDNAAKEFANATGRMCFIEQAEKSVPELMLNHKIVAVASVPSLVNRLDQPLYDPKRWGLIISDEAHDTAAPQWLRILEHFGIIRRAQDARGRKKWETVPIGEGQPTRHLGLTATPNRADGKALRPIYDTVAYEYEIGVAVGDGWLVEPIEYTPKIDGLDLSAINKHGRDFSDEEIEALLMQDGGRRVHELAATISEIAGARKTIIFTSGVESAHLIARVLNKLLGGEKAVAVDGTTEEQERQRKEQGFAAGDYQFMTNFGIYTHGYNLPGIEVVAILRISKSVSLITQMVGRGTRPLPGLVDAHGTAAERLAAIAASAKPHLVVIRPVGACRTKLAGCMDALGGRFKPLVIELAEQMAAEASEDGEAVRPRQMLEKAVKEVEQRVTNEVRKALPIKALFQVETASMLTDDARPTPAPTRDISATRGGATDPQVALLVNLGVPWQVAIGYGKKQAGAVINSLKAKRCTTRKAAFLRRNGHDPASHNVDSASRIIDRIKSGEGAAA